MKSAKVFFSLIFLFQLSSTQGFAAAVPGVTDKEIKIGNHSIQSGQQAFFGAVQRVAKAYFETINEAGGINGRKINYIISDNAGNPQTALQVMKKQVDEDKIFAVFGSGQQQHLSVFRYLQQQGVPDMWIIDYAPDYTEKTNPTTFQFVMPSTDEAKFHGENIAKKWPGKTIGMLYPNTSFGRKGFDAFKAAAGDKVKIVGEEVDPAVDTMAKTQVLNLKKAGAEVVFSTSTPPLTPSAIKFATEQGFKPQWIVSTSNRNKVFLELAGKAGEGVMVLATNYSEDDTDHPGVKKHMEWMAKKMPNEKFNNISIMGQALAEATVEVLTRAGKDLTRESLVKAAESIKDWQCSVCYVEHTVTPTSHKFYFPKILLKRTNDKWVKQDSY